MNFNEHSIDGLNTIYCDELFIGGTLFTTGVGFFFAKNETISYTRVTGHTHRHQSRTSAGHTGACGLLDPHEGGPLRTKQKYKQAYEIICTVDGERGGVRRKSINA